MFNRSIMTTALVISSCSLCGSAQAEEYKATQVAPLKTAKGAGVMKSAGVYTESATGALKDRSMPNSGQVTIAASADTQPDRTVVLTATGSGAGK